MSKLQIAKKQVDGVTVGFVVGFPVWRSRWDHRGKGLITFRSIRNGAIFKSKKKAREFRDRIEKARRADPVTAFSVVD